MILIVVGLFAAIQTEFRDFGPLVILGVGAFFLAGKIYPDYSIDRFVIPVVLMAVGLVVILSPRRKFKRREGDVEMSEPPLVATEETSQPGEASQPGYDKVEIVSIFGNVKKVIYSKRFSGGEVVSIFGGAELNLSQADITGPVHLEMVQIFGGAKLIVPAHWEVRSEAVAILGGIDDKRPPQTITSPDKVLILEGTVVFGGIEIRSY
jgi:predicted membrane protein